ncbi:lipid kinase YegS [Luteimonas sp. TWI662]|uniref:lipid kinase YegS n=1 Tax=Luteimonas sp. TWI662 TaxID=3136789 RepID=UPI00320B2387
MPAPSWCLILNGKSAGVEAVREAVAAMRGRGIALAVRVTWEARDAARFVDEALVSGVETLVVGGGDGTLNAVVSALAARPEAADALPSLGVLPLGTANDFATAAQLPIDPHDALSLVAELAPRPVDVLRVAADDAVLWCANLASGGFGTQVTVDTRDALKRVLGGLAYFVTGLSRLGRIEPIQARVRGPEFAWDGGLVALGIGNGRQAGGGQALCPDAWIDDGMIDLTIVPEFEGEVVAALRTALVEGKVAALDQVAVRRRLPRLVVEADAPMALNLDGEPVQAARFDIQCVPARLRMHLPADCALLSKTPAAAR